MTDQTRRALFVALALGGALLAAPILPAMCTMKRNGTRSMMAENDPPKRPPGQPKPLLEENIAPVLARLDSWYAAHLPPGQFVFNPPASEIELDAFEGLIGLKLPNAYRQLYRWHDGDKNDLFSGHIFGTPLASLHRAGLEWKAWNGVLADFGGNRYAIAGGAWPTDAVDPAYINPRWIPLTSSDGNHIGIDFDPWPGGRVGQIILFGRDEDVKVVLAESLGTFLDWIADLLESGNFMLTSAKDGPPVRFGLKKPATHDFLDGARTLVGAPGPFL